MGTDSLKKHSINWFPVLLFLIAIVTWRGDYYRLSLYVAIPILIVVAFFRWGKNIFNSRYWWLFFLLIVWMLLSALVNDHRSTSFQRMIPVLASFLLSFSVYAIALKGDNAKVLYLSYCVFFFVLMYLSITKTGFIQDFDYSNERDRESHTLMDANEYAYYSFFLVISFRMFLECLNKSISKALLFIIYIILLVITVYVALLTAARQVMYLNIPLIFLFIYHDFVRGGNVGNKLLFFIAAIVVIAVGLPVFDKYYNNSFLATRSEVSFAEDTRSRMMENAMKIAIEHPLFGVGLGADITFSHNTYTHLASRCGLPALFLYVIILLRFIFTQFKRWKRAKDSTYFLYLVCGFFYLVGNFLYNYIDGPFMMAILFVLIGDSERYHKESLQLQIK